MWRLGIVVLLLATGCGVESEVPSAKPAGPNPPCAEIWKAESQLPSDYKSCVRADGTSVSSQARTCTKSGRLVTFEDRFWVMTPGKIWPVDGSLVADPGYQEALHACQTKPLELP